MHKTEAEEIKQQTKGKNKTHLIDIEISSSSSTAADSLKSKEALWCVQV